MHFVCFPDDGISYAQGFSDTGQRTECHFFLQREMIALSALQQKYHVYPRCGMQTASSQSHTRFFLCTAGSAFQSQHEQQCPGMHSVEKQERCRPVSQGVLRAKLCPPRYIQG